MVAMLSEWFLDFYYEEKLDSHRACLLYAEN